MHAMRAFARCSEVRPQAPGYCHGSLASAAQLANHEVCAGQSLTQTVCTMQGTDCHQVTGAEGQGAASSETTEALKQYIATLQQNIEEKNDGEWG